MAIVVALACMPALAQVTLDVHLQQPMPRSFGEWQNNDRNLVMVTITNHTTTQYNNVRLSGYVRDVDHDKVVARTRDNDPNMPRFTVPPQSPLGAPGILILRGRECINGNAISIDNQVKTQAITTNSLPEGNFEFCAKLIKEDGTELTTNGGGCPSFGVVIPDPPALIAPDHQQSFASSVLPSFTWAQVAPVPPGTIIEYWLKIVPVFQGQSPKDAIDHNEVLFRAPTVMTSYQYLPTDRPFSSIPSVSTWAWQILAYDETGKPITSNEGKSEVRTFHFEAPPVLTPPPSKDASGGR